ncbi:MAG: PQQ-dependent sugar dehydrogenase [Chloroflexota bacterium]
MTPSNPGLPHWLARLPAAALLVPLLLVACGPSQDTPTPVPTTAGASPTTAGASPTTAEPSESPTTAIPAATSAPFDPTGVSLDVEVVTDRLDQPVDVAVPDDGSGRVFVAERPGRIRVVRDGVVDDEPFLDIRERIASGGERGLLGLAFHPDFPDDPRFFVDYTDVNGDTVMAEYRQDESDPAVGDPDSERVLLHIDQPYPNHNGGAVVFGSDGMLYVAMGDGGSGGDPHGNGQRLDTLLGKILRIDVDDPGDERRGYGIPNDNPYLDAPEAMPEIWLTGLRNPWRIRFDEATGDLWIGDVGQGAWEEIDVAPAGVGALNFGWNRMEGFECFEPREGCDEAGLTMPVAAYGHDLGCAVIGGVVIRDPHQPLLNGGYLFSDSCSGNLWLLDPARDERHEPTLVTNSGESISSIALGADGTVLATALGGKLVRITGAAR